MDPSEPGERCLPEMGLSGWMKRTMERSYDLSDFCNSPPVDGFYYPANFQQKGNTVLVRGNCSAEALKKKEEQKNCSIMGAALSINQAQPLGHGLASNVSMYQAAGISNMSVAGCNAITSGDTTTVPDYLKPVVSGFTSSAFSKQRSLGLSQPSPVSATPSPTNSEDGRDGTSSPEEIRSWNNAGDDMYNGSEQNGLIQSDDSAPTPVDHIISARFTPTIQINAQEDGGESLRLVEKLGAGHSSCPATPDVTPNTTPAVTPSCSPQVARRAGNPFFTGGSEETKSGSWLFRPGKKPGDGNSLKPDQLYEAKIEYQQQPNAKGSKKTVRYVPRPSELRELNFWSPTSM